MAKYYLFFVFLLLLFACNAVKFDENSSIRTLEPTYLGLKSMILINENTFWMGSNDGKTYEKPVHEVHLASFYIDETLVSFGDFDKYVKSGGEIAFFWKTYKSENSPVNGVTWHQAVDYCNWRSKVEGFEPAYMRTGLLDAWGYPIYELEKSKNGYRLPTEAEFEYAARGGLHQKKYVWGDIFDENLTNIDSERGNPIGNKLRLTKIKSHQPNLFGLYDMSGNVWEWCHDWFGFEYYQYADEKSPMGEMRGRTKVLRGGSWGTTVLDRATVYARSWAAPSHYNYDIGFRCVRPAVSSIPQKMNLAIAHEFYQVELKPHLQPIDTYFHPTFALRLASYLREHFYNSIYFHQTVDEQNMLTPESMADLILDVCLEKQINPAFLVGIMSAESGLGTCSVPRWYNNPMAFRWQNVLMKNGPPVYEDMPYQRNRKFKNLREGFEAFCDGLKRHAYTDAAHKDLYDFHIVYVGYEAKEWIYVVRKVYKDLLRQEIDVHIPTTNIGEKIYLDWHNIKADEQQKKDDFLSKQSGSTSKLLHQIMPEHNRFYLICGSFDTYEEAKKSKASLVRKGYFGAKVIFAGRNFRVSVADTLIHKEATDKLKKLAPKFETLWVWKN